MGNSRRSPTGQAGDKAHEERAIRVDELVVAGGDHDGADTWHRISAAVDQLANQHAARTAALIGTDPQQPPAPPALAGESHA
jgi:hypothetical protein